MMSATEASIGSPCATARRSARYTSLGKRARCASSLKVSEPNSSLALRADPEVLCPDVQLLMLADAFTCRCRSHTK